MLEWVCHFVQDNREEGQGSIKRQDAGIRRLRCVDQVSGLLLAVKLLIPISGFPTRMFKAQKFPSTANFTATSFDIFRQDVKAWPSDASFQHRKAYSRHGNSKGSGGHILSSGYSEFISHFSTTRERMPLVHKINYHHSLQGFRRHRASVSLPYRGGAEADIVQLWSLTFLSVTRNSNLSQNTCDLRE